MYHRYFLSQLISLLTIKTRKLIGVNRVSMEESLKCLNIVANIKAQGKNDMWDILLATEDVSKSLAGNILTAKTDRLQTEYMATRKTKFTLYGVLLYITKDHLRFAKIKEVGDVLSVKSNAGISTGDFEIMVTLTRENFMDIPNVMTCVRPANLCCGWRPLSSLPVLCCCRTSFEILSWKQTGTRTPIIYKQRNNRSGENEKRTQGYQRMYRSGEEGIEGWNPKY